MGDCSFGGVSFYVLPVDGLARPDFPSRPTLARRRAPYGTRTVTQNLGDDLQPLTVAVELASGDLAALRALRGTLGTLALTGGVSFTNTMLDALDNVRVDGTTARAFADATFSR